FSWGTLQRRDAPRALGRAVYQRPGLAGPTFRARASVHQRLLASDGFVSVVCGGLAPIVEPLALLALVIVPTRCVGAPKQNAAQLDTCSSGRLSPRELARGMSLIMGSVRQS